MHYISSWCNPIDSTWSSIQSHKFYANLENKISQSTFTCYKRIHVIKFQFAHVHHVLMGLNITKQYLLHLNVLICELASLFIFFLLSTFFSSMFFFHSVSISIYIFLEMENFSMFIINKFSNKFSSVIFEIDFIGFYSEPYSQWDIFNLM